MKTERVYILDIHFVAKMDAFAYCFNAESHTTGSFHVDMKIPLDQSFNQFACYKFVLVFKHKERLRC